MKTIDTDKALFAPTRRNTLALTLAVAAAPMLGARAFALPPQAQSHDLRPQKVAEGVWVIPGAQDKITAANGGAIANVLVFDSKEGAILVDTGPSYNYGRELDAVVRTLTGKPVARIFLTHIHADHSLGASAFDPKVLYGAEGLAADLKARGNDISDAMYRVAGDRMRGTNVPEPAHVAVDGLEEVGGRRFRCLPMSGHTANDLCLFEETSGLLIAGDIVFLDRAPTTPDADLPAWRRSLSRLADIPHAKLVPGHGPVEAGGRGIEQTRRWLDFVDDQITTSFNRGLDEIEMMAEPMPEWTSQIAVGQFEYQRSVMHLLPKIEVARLPVLAKA